MSMIIKKLELQGFKSFADRTKVAFHPGITAIVGPNGTGKSNLVDALLWVQGGHRQKTVRGDRTEDVIFNGNAKKPALSMADVVLTLGSDDEELVVSHRVFRSGESEYRLNGKTARLKDVQDELWKHAIGETEYFVIEQGAIGNFVTAKPTEKRALIEEAAGTAYYKDKKRQAQTKLENTEINLTRLEDIIAEVEKAKNSLQRQAQAANRYRRLRERIRELTSHHYERKFETLERAQKEAAALYAEGLAREQEVTARIHAREKDLAGKRRALWDLEKSLKESQEKLFAVKSQIARIESESERESKRIEFFDEQKKRSEADRNELLADVIQFTKEIEETRARLEGLTGEYASKEADVREAERLLHAAREEKSREDKEIEGLRESYLMALQDLTETKNEDAKADKELELLARQEERLSTQHRELIALIEDTSARAASIQSEIAGHETLRGSAAAKAEALGAATAQAAAGIVALESRLAELKAKRDEHAYHLQALRKIEDKERGETTAGDIPGALGLLADLVRTSPEDAPLFDVFWREEARSRVVPAEELLKGIPEGLKGSYLLVPAAARPGISEEVLARPGVIGLLKSRLEPNDTIKDRLAGFEDAVIVSDIGSAIRIWLDHPHLNFLTPTGDLLLASGLLKLGQKAGDGMIALAAEIRTLTETISRFEAEMVPAVAELEAASRERVSLEDVLRMEKDLAVREERSLDDKRKELRFIQAEAERARQARDVLSKELTLLRADKDALAGRLGQLAETLLARESSGRTLKEDIERREQAVAGRQENAAAAERRYFEAKAALDLLREKMNGLEAQVQATEKRNAAARAKIDALEEETRRGEGDKDRLKAAIQTLGETIQSLSEERSTGEEAQSEAEAELVRVRADLEEAEGALEKARAEEEAVKDGRVRYEIRKAEVERDLVNLDEMCWQELKKTLAELRAESEAAKQAAQTAALQPESQEAEDLEEPLEDEEASETPAETAGEARPEGEAVEGEAKAEAPAETVKPRRIVKKWRPLLEMTDDEVEQELDEARESLNRFKAVNLMAEEEFLEQKKRFEFLVEQRKDLRESITSTEEAIRKIDEESKVQFLKALEEVNKNFQDLFTGLFKGGNAEVKLIEPDNPLESGIDIVAQPPGKRVQNLSLLSGGEKSLTSLAFLFSLFRYRPSPFCFLDEVDAALDDVNLSRFLELLKKIKHQTQFILITHNYKTMEVADYIYGTTMTDPNMTKLLSVKLEKKGGGEVLNGL